MKQELKINGAFKNLLDGKEIKMLTSNYKTNIFYLNQNRSYNEKPIVCHITNTKGNVITKYITYDDFKEKFKDNTFIIIEWGKL